MCCVQVSSKHALIWKHKDTWGAFKVSKRWLIKFWSHSDPFHRSLPLVGLTHIYSSFAANWDVSCQVPLNSETLVALGLFHTLQSPASFSHFVWSLFVLLRSLLTTSLCRSFERPRLPSFSACTLFQLAKHDILWDYSILNASYMANPTQAAFDEVWVNADHTQNLKDFDVCYFVLPFDSKDPS